jgi:hypothetical protein
VIDSIVHESDAKAELCFDQVLLGIVSLDHAVSACNDHSVGARSRFYRLVDEYTDPTPHPMATDGYVGDVGP